MARVNDQHKTGRNFGLKSWVPIIQKETEAPTGPETRGEKAFPAHPTRAMGESLYAPHDPGSKRVYCNLISADRLC